MAPRYEHAHHGSTPTAPQVHFYDFLARAMVRTVTLSDGLRVAACAAAPIVAVGGASGGVRLAAHPFDASDNALFAPADMARYLALPSYQCLIPDPLIPMLTAVHASPPSHPIITPPQVMHASSVRSLHFVGDSLLYTASEDEVAQWNLPLF